MFHSFGGSVVEAKSLLNKGINAFFSFVICIPFNPIVNNTPTNNINTISGTPHTKSDILLTICDILSIISILERGKEKT